MAAPCKTISRLLRPCSLLSRNHGRLLSQSTLSRRLLSKKILQSGNDLSANRSSSTDAADENTVETRDAIKYEEKPDALYSKLLVEVKGHDNAVLHSYSYFVVYASKCLGLNGLQVQQLKTDIARSSHLASVHIFKKHYVQYEQRTHYRLYSWEGVTGSTADTFLEYIQRNLPEGVAMKVTKHRLEAIPSNLKPPPGQKKFENNLEPS